MAPRCFFLNIEKLERHESFLSIALFFFTSKDSKDSNFSCLLLLTGFLYGFALGENKRKMKGRGEVSFVLVFSRGGRCLWCRLFLGRRRGRGRSGWL